MLGFWTIRPNLNGVPALPASVSYSSPGDISLLVSEDHKHVRIGGVTLAAEDGHFHYVFADGETETVGGEEHESEVQTDVYFLCFVTCNEEDLPELIEEPWNVLPLAEARFDEEEGFGSLKEVQWDEATETRVRAVALETFGLQVPARINNGPALINWMLGTLLSRTVTNEISYR